MHFEFDRVKSAANRAKHGIDFEQAQQLWTDPDLLKLPARTVDEVRYLVVGKVGSRHWTAVATDRGPAIRIISVRRSRLQEVFLYESQRI